MAIFYMQITYCHHHDVGQLSSTRLCYHVASIANKQYTASPKSANMTTQPSSPSKLSAGLQNINNTNKLSRVMPYLKLQLSHVPLLTILFHGSPALVGLGLLIIEGL